MDQKRGLKPFISHSFVAQQIAERGYLWQMDFLEPDKLIDFSTEHGVSGLMRNDGHLLWRLGLLRADLVVSHRKLKRAGLLYLKTDELGQHLYADLREPIKPRGGWKLAGSAAPAFPSYVKPMFHPFRFLMLHHLGRNFELNIGTLQMLYSDRYPSMIDLEVSQFQQFFGSAQFLDKLRDLDRIVTLTICLEPLQFSTIFQKRRYPRIIVDEQWLDESAINSHTAAYRKLIEDQFVTIDLQQLEEARRSLCFDADLLDRNKQLHVLLRLANGDARLKLQGQVGGAMHLLAMAEMLRRMAEEIFDTNLPEEDELGLGWWPAGARERAYGTPRLFDGNRRSADEFLHHQFRLGFRERAHWYVEGLTEYAALHYVFEKNGPTHISVYNLRGNVVQRGGKGLAFRDNLRMDIRQAVFSFVSLDGDATDSIRVLRQAASADPDEMFGYVRISQPDFEFGNFDLPELEMVLWEIATENGASARSCADLHSAIIGCGTGEALIKAAKHAVPELGQVGKGQLWGEKLIRYALEHRMMANGQLRPIVEAIKLANGTEIYHYRESITTLQVDPASWTFVKRTRRLPDGIMPLSSDA